MLTASILVNIDIGLMMKKILFIFLFFILLQTQNLFAGNDSTDPLAQIDYAVAFDQEALYQKFIDLMTSVKCDKNTRVVKKLFQRKNPSREKYYQAGYVEIPVISVREEDILTEEESAFSVMNSTQWEVFEVACLEQLRRAKRWAITEPAREAMANLVLLTAAVGGAVSILGVDTYGGSISIFSGLYTAATRFFPGIVKSAYNLYYTPAHPLDELEVCFALNKCFIPKAIWPSIVKNFMMARQNSFAQQQSIDFIEFSLGLTPFRPRPSVKLQGHMSITEQAVDETFKTLSHDIQAFFEDYEPMDKEQFDTLRMSVVQFVNCLLGRGKAPRYVYLYSSGGMGKNFFTEKLYEWIERTVPGSVHFESFVITSPEELEGSQNKPGMFLRVLRNQCLARKRGSIVFMDEADWLNKESMMSSAKRVFNGESTRVATTYFGTGVDGTGIHFDMPPMLVVASANDQIANQHLNGRFDVIKFPNPKSQALISYGVKLFDGNSIFHKKSNPRSLPAAATHEKAETKSPVLSKSDSAIEERLRKRVSTCKSFREVEAVVPAFVCQRLDKEDMD